MAKDACQVMLAKTWDDHTDPTGWWMSEKLDGVRAYWDGSNIFSRQGNAFVAPDYWKASLPKTPLDGELWCGHGTFSECMSVIKKTVNLNPDEWKKVNFLIFDAPKQPGTYEERVKYLQKTISKSTYCRLVGIAKCKGKEHLEKLLQDVTKNKGGEGIMLRKPGSQYEWKRSGNLLKVKLWFDEEAKVYGYKPGNSNPNHKHLQCELPSGNKFSIGNGLTNDQLLHPPPIGSIITFKFQEYTHLGTPRFPTFLRQRDDLTWEDVKKNWKTVNDKQKKSIARGKSLLFDDTTGGSASVLTAPTLVSLKTQATPAPDTNLTKPMCQFGEMCTRKNPSHFQEWDHPVNFFKEHPELKPMPAKTPPTCKYGIACTRRNADHFQNYTHPPDHPYILSSKSLLQTKTNAPTTEIENDNEITIEMDDDIITADPQGSSPNTPQSQEDNELEMQISTSAFVQVTQKEYKDLLNRIQTLESLVGQLAKRPRDDSDEEPENKPPPKKKKKWFEVESE